jgi:hypothetical protein
MKTDGEFRALAEDAVSLTSETVQALTDEIAGRKLDMGVFTTILGCVRYPQIESSRTRRTIPAELPNFIALGGS